MLFKNGCGHLLLLSNVVHVHKQSAAVTDILIHTTLAIFYMFFLQSECVIAQKQGYRLEEMIGEELGHKLAVEISQRFMRVSLHFIAAFSSS